MLQPNEQIVEEARRMLRLCETCIYLVEVAGGPDHGDYRCTSKDSLSFNRRVPENLHFGFRYDCHHDYEIKDAIEEIERLRGCKCRIPLEENV